MTKKRRSNEAGHKRKYLVVIDDTEECDRAVFWAATRAARTKSQIVMLRVIETAEEIVKLIDEDSDIGILVLGAGTGNEGPGPLITHLAKNVGTYPIPVAI